MLKSIITRDLPGGRGRVHINWDGMVWVQQGRPWGVMANAGEVFLDQRDLKIISDMLQEFEQSGGEILGPEVIQPL